MPNMRGFTTLGHSSSGAYNFSSELASQRGNRENNNSSIKVLRTGSKDKKHAPSFMRDRDS